MNLNITQHINTINKLVVKHAPTILSSAGAVGVVTTTILAVKATPKAHKKIEKLRFEVAQMRNSVLSEDEQLSVEDIHISFSETFVLTWKDFLPTAISGVLTIGAIFYAHKINLNRSAALLGAYTMTDKLYSEYKEKVEEKFGKEKGDEIIEAMAQDSVSNEPPIQTEIIDTRNGTTLFKDGLSGRYFRSSMERVRKAMNDVNENIFQTGEASLNEYYSALDLDGIGIGESLGWDTDVPCRLHFSSALTPDDQSCVVVAFDNLPFNRYNRN